MNGAAHRIFRAGDRPASTGDRPASARLRTIVLSFDTVDEAEAWDLVVQEQGTWAALAALSLIRRAVIG